MEIFYLDKHPYVELCDLLKLQGWCASGAAAKQEIAAGMVRVDGQVEMRKRCKIIDGQRVTYANQTVQVKT